MRWLTVRWRLCADGAAQPNKLVPIQSEGNLLDSVGGNSPDSSSTGVALSKLMTDAGKGPPAAGSVLPQPLMQVLTLPSSSPFLPTFSAPPAGAAVPLYCVFPSFSYSLPLCFSQRKKALVLITCVWASQEPGKLCRLRIWRRSMGCSLSPLM